MSLSAAVIIDWSHPFLNQGIVQGMGARLATLGHTAHLLSPGSFSPAVLKRLGPEVLLFHDYAPIDTLSMIQRYSGIRVGILQDTPWADGYVCCNDDLIGEVAGEHLLGLGTSHFACVSMEQVPWSVDRLEGFRRTVARRGFSLLQYAITKPEEPARFRHEYIKSGDRLSNWLASLPKMTAIFVVNDAWARHVLDCCLSLGRAVPDDLSVLGADNDEVWCEMGQPTLSSVVIPWRKFGQTCVDTAIELVNRKPSARQVVRISPEGIVVRHSSSAIHGRNSTVVAGLRHLRQEAMADITLDEILRLYPMDRRLFERSCRMILGRTPYQELLRLRLENARRLLAITDLKVAEIARRSCLNPQHIAKLFRRHYGVTPEVYRQGENEPARS